MMWGGNTFFIYFMENCQQQNLEIKCVAILGVMHLLSHLFYFMSQSFLAHNSGSLFYFFVCIIFYSLIRSSRSSSYQKEKELKIESQFHD